MSREGSGKPRRQLVEIAKLREIRRATWVVLRAITELVDRMVGKV